MNPSSRLPAQPQLADRRCRTRKTTLLGLASFALLPALAAAEAAGTGPVASSVLNAPTEFSLLDRRTEDPGAVRTAASAAARDGVVLVWFGGSADAGEILRAAASESARDGMPVRAAFLAGTSGEAAVEAVTVLGPDGAPFGEPIARSADMKERLKARIRDLAASRSGAGATIGTAAVPAAASDGEKRCRMENLTGSRVRKTRVCTSTKEEAQGSEKAQKWTRDIQNRGGLGDPGRLGGG